MMKLSVVAAMIAAGGLVGCSKAKQEPPATTGGDGKAAPTAAATGDGGAAGDAAATPAAAGGGDGGATDDGGTAAAAGTDGDGGPGLPGTHPANRIVKSASRPCAPEEIRAARKAAGPLAKKGDYAGVIKQLEALEAECYLTSRIETPDDEDEEPPNLEFFWFYSDLAFATFKAGDAVRCIQLLAPLTTPKPPDSLSFHDLEDSKVGRAIFHNDELCRKAQGETRKKFTTPACSLATADEPAVALPASALPAGATAGCLVLTGGEGYEEFQKELNGERESDGLCPAVTLRTTKGSGKPTDVALKTDGEGPLDDTSNCCNLGKIAFAVDGGQRLVWVTGGGRDCYGGTADADIDAVFAWKGNELEYVDGAMVVNH